MVLLNAMSNDRLPGLKEWRWSKDMLDSAVRFEVEKTRGKPSILWQQDNPKPNDRKFGYKKKDMRHPVRKPQPEEPVSTYSTVRNGRSPENFIKKNRDSLGQPASNSTTGSKLNPNTVTLTQEQLNAILASVGRLNSSGTDSELHLIIDNENNEIHVKKSPRTMNGEESLNQDCGDSNVLSLADYDKHYAVNESSNGTHDIKKDVSLGSRDHTDINGTTETNSGIDLPPLVHKNHMTVGERKRLQWARERGEQQGASDPFSQHRTYQNTSTLNGPFYTEHSLPATNGTSAPLPRRAVVEPRSRPAESEKADTYDPWGKPGGGARHAQLVKPEDSASATKYDFMGRPVQENALIQDMYDVKPQKSRDSKKEWMAELEKQMQEQKQRKLKERQEEKTLGDMSWLDRFTADYKPAPLPEQLTSVQDRLSKLDVI
ncbi:uncharacterized protein LOC121367990 isoform X2 [Gigantopelta aegis]|uniref:uncharacterized protein LOC121367990 isoform X2 n=1 Tax=Gigantopelta aegis TaxID=1735272 RepID=UPI001B889382|nr:uncharacterized protein LOC121367990 isoform X2 [Gigantopelta aegis]